MGRRSEMPRRSIIVILILFLSACSLPETKVYSLYIPVDKAAVGIKTDASIVITVHSPRYLAQPYIAFRISPYQLEISRYSKWVSSPDDMIRDEFRTALSSTGLFKEVTVSPFSHIGFYSLVINLRKFERLDEGNSSFGELLLDADLLGPDSRTLYHGTITKKVHLDDRGFLSLARGLSLGLVEGLNEVRPRIEEAMKNQSSEAGGKE